MRIWVGTTLDGLPVRIDSTIDDLVVFVGDPGTGKTTHARFLLRWWTATQRPATVLTSRPDEYADYRTRTESYIRTFGLLPRRPPSPRDVLANGLAPPELLIVDDGDHLEKSLLHELVLRRRARGCLTLVTSQGPAAQSLAEVADLTIGLLPGGCHDDEAGQGRLDWPPGSIITRPRRRGCEDQPPHRWQDYARVRDASLRCGR